MHFVRYSSFSFICYILIFSVVGGLASRDEMISYFKEGEYWSYSEPTTIDASFGPYREFPRVGRETQLHEIWKNVLTCNEVSVNRLTALYFHGSPGLGETYLLRKIFSKQDFPSEDAERVEAVKFLVLDFNRNACSDADGFKEYFKNRPRLFALSRLYYVNFAVQSKLEWTEFLEMNVVPLIVAGLAIQLEELMKQQLRSFKGESRCVILVDEITRTEVLGVDFADMIRTSICIWMDQGLCKVVLFSTLDADFMLKENRPSDRSVRAVATLPLLNSTESILFLNDNVKAAFVDGEEIPQDDRDTVVRQLALASGGHPRSIETIINGCNYQTRPRQIKEVIDAAALDMCARFREVENSNEWLQLFISVLLGEKVKGYNLLVDDDPTSESYKSLVNRGVLIDSFEGAFGLFIPTVPELYLHSWKYNSHLDERVRLLLWQILKTRYDCTPVKFELFCSSWEQLMRRVRQGKPTYSKIPLNELYRLKLRDGAAPAASCLVDGRSILTGIKYAKGTNITLQPNTIYKPRGTKNAGWDRLIALEVFEVSPGSNTWQRYLLPLFIQNKFNKDAAMTELDVDYVKKANEHCKTFVESHVTFDSRFSPIPMVGDNFVLLFVAKCKKNDNVSTDSPSNVMFCVGEDLEKLYGPSLKGVVSTI